MKLNLIGLIPTETTERENALLEVIEGLLALTGPLTIGMDEEKRYLIRRDNRPSDCLLAVGCVHYLVHFLLNNDDKIIGYEKGGKVRVWPDGTMQWAEDEPFSNMSDDFTLVEYETLTFEQQEDLGCPE